MEKASIICISCNHIMFVDVEDNDKIEWLTCSRCGAEKRYLPSEVKRGIKDYKNIWEE